LFQAAGAAASAVSAGVQSIGAGYDCIERIQLQQPGDGEAVRTDDGGESSGRHGKLIQQTPLTFL